MLLLNNMFRQPGANCNEKRVGRGTGSGSGTTAGKGDKGQKARSGRGNLRLGFEGGQTPLYRRLPKQGFKNFARRQWAVLNVGDLVKGDYPSEISLESLKKANKIKSSLDRLAVLGTGELNKTFKVKAHKVTESAKEKITKAGGSVETIALPTKMKRQKKK